MRSHMLMCGVLAAVLSVACHSDTAATTLSVTHEISVSPASAVVAIGDSVQFTVRLSSDLSAAGVRLRTSRPDIVRISSSGWASGVTTGTAQIIAVAIADTLVTVQAPVDVVARR